jgi:hypothetical protein
MSINVENVAQAYAATLADAIKNKWLTWNRAMALIEDMTGHMPLARAGQRRFAHLTHNALDHIISMGKKEAKP